MRLGQKLKIDRDQRLHREGGVQGNRDKLIFFAVKTRDKRKPFYANAHKEKCMYEVRNFFRGNNLCFGVGYDGS